MGHTSGSQRFETKKVRCLASVSFFDGTFCTACRIYTTQLTYEPSRPHGKHAHAYHGCICRDSRSPAAVHWRCAARQLVGAMGANMVTETRHVACPARHRSACKSIRLATTEKSAGADSFAAPANTRQHGSRVPSSDTFSCHLDVCRRAEC